MGSAAAAGSAWFSYDPEGHGMLFHDTADAARRAAESAMEVERDEASAEFGGWSDLVTDICWGEVRQRAAAIPAPEGFEDYELQPNNQAD